MSTAIQGETTDPSWLGRAAPAQTHDPAVDAAAAEEKELDSLRDRLQADGLKASDVLSTSVRTVATGLTLIVYTFLTADKYSVFIKAHFTAMKWASILGASALFADALHYVFALMQIELTRSLIRIRQTIEPVDARFVVAARTNVFFYARNALFFTKIVLTAIGSALVIGALLSTDVSILAQ